MRDWNKKNPDKKLAIDRKYYQKNKERCDNYRKEWGKTNPKKLLKIKAKYRENNREKLQLAGKLYRKKNPHIAKQSKIRRRIRELNLNIEAKLINYDLILKRDKRICHICNKKVKTNNLHFDHVIPLSKGGPHTIENIKVSHSWCNWKKGNRILKND